VATDDCYEPDRVPLIRLLNDLLVMELALLQTYDAATAGLRDGLMATQLRHFEVDHERHLIELRSCVGALGGSPVADCRGTVSVSLSPVSASLTSLIAMWSHEDEMARAYENALERRMVLSAPVVRRTLCDILEDEQRHWAWLALRVEGHHRQQHLH